MKTTTQGWFPTFSGAIVAVATLLGITGVAFASGGQMFNPGSLNNQAGPPLSGVASHSEIQQCSACHATPWGTETMADRCLQCHSDITAQLEDPTSLHSLVRFGQTDLNCRTCHTEHHGPTASLTRIPPGWDPHDQLGFSLKTHRLRMDGTPFECKDCHENGYSGPFDQLVCATCHLKVDQVFTQDHILTFWTDCQACHDGLDSHGSTFDHNQVPFNLVGLHALTLCSQCHVNARNMSDLQATTQDCFACHEKDDQHLGQFGTKCGICHTAEGWGKSAQFDHNLANFKLTGLHVKVTCNACHINNKYKGIPSDCFSCHAKDDKHAGQFGTDCASCHTSDGWNRAVDHSQFAFHLDGKHATVACESCHQNADFKNTPTDCVACHAKDDTHAGQLGNQCGTCHTPEDWTSAVFDHNSVAFTLTAHKTKSDGTAFVCKDCHIKNYARPFDQIACANCHLRVDQVFAQEHILAFWTNCMACHDGVDSHGKAFDHNKAPFNLIGKHALAKCSNCHINDRTIADMQATSQECYTCHQKDDFHNGQFGTSCGSCHSPEAWKPANVDHSKFAFHLDGKHATVACQNCHINGVFKGTPMDCASCHTKDDAHAGQLGNQCGTCHTPAGWKPATIDHSKFAFHLDGKHATAGCTSCHINNVFKGTPQDCASCHTKDDAHAGQLGALCGTCHTPAGWKPATVDHSKFAFHLDGKHATAACTSCHINNVFKGTPQDCAACHTKDDAHAGSLGTQCGTCHNPAGWSPASFDHNTVSFKLTAHKTKTDGTAFACKDCHVKGYAAPFDQNTCGNCHLQIDQPFFTEHFLTFGINCMACHDGVDSHGSNFDHNKVPFNLIGKHAPVKCSACHVNARNLNDLKSAPQACISCHAKDDKHNGQFGTDCAACHSPEGWGLAKVDHSKFAFKLDGKHATVACESCHKNGVFKGTPMDCASCHTKDDAHAGQLGTLCGACHTPNGWKPATVDHSKFAFHLDGKHSTVACESCHKNGVFKGTPMDCASCHTKDDAHAGQLGALCGACHAPTGWKPATVDHSKFAFHLDGKHAAVACTSCHVNNVFKGTPMDCASCHTKDDAHAGTLGAQCGTCHNPAGWSPAIFDHNTVSFKLTAHKKKTDGTAFACKDCHVKGYAAPFDQASCVNCHFQINQAFTTEHTLTFGTDCMGCHDGIDSHGSNFDHNKVLFTLIGKHAPVKCSACHINARKLADLKAAPQDCFACHQKDDNHNGELGTNCAACHSPNGWKPATVDHSKFAFHLDGKHATVACESCHKNGQFKGTPMDCAACHTKDDAHAGTLGTQCETCHNPAGWSPAIFDHNIVSFKLTAHKKMPNGAAFVCKDCHVKGYAAPFDQNTCGNCHLQINQAFSTEHFLTFGINCMACHDGVESLGTNFNHNLVPFKLIFKHAPLACSKCHVSARNLNDLKSTPQACISCHAKDDKHNGQFGTDCAACHSPEGWGLAKVDHSKFAFKLDGKHATVACESCHKNGVFKGTPMDCASCHTKNDAHNGTLGNQCATCHTPNGWKPSTFDHNNAAFHLDGKHTSVACQSCHINGVFKGTPMDCASCHTKNDPHAGKLGAKCADCHTTSGWTPSTFDHKNSSFLLTGKHTAVACAQCHKDKFFVGTPANCSSCHNNADPHSGALGAKCETCHTTNGWKPSAFNHANSIFKLTGKHTTVACGSCHKDLKFKGTPTTCYACHAANDHHGGKYGTNCAACHSTSAWKPATFDHNLSSFPLTGAHVNTACTKCHINGVFVGTPKDCYSCHKAKDAHAGKYGTNCGTCHATTAWKPATFKHTFPLDHGDGGTVACATCHPSSTSSYTCYGCHEHTLANIEDKHKDVRNFSQDCVQCHANGKKND